MDYYKYNSYPGNWQNHNDVIDGPHHPHIGLAMAKLAGVLEMTYGVAAVRVRLIRNELQSGNSITVYKSRREEEVATITHGPDVVQRRTTSDGALLAVMISVGQNGAYDNEIRDSRILFLLRGGSTHPMRPTAQRVRLFLGMFVGNLCNNRKGRGAVGGEKASENGPGR